MATNFPPQPGPAANPPRKKISPLVWILIGILGLFAFAAIAVTALGFFAYHKAKQAGFDVALLEKKPELAFLKMAVAANPDAEIVSIDEDRGIVSVKDTKTGKTITMNFEDIKQGRLTFEEGGQKLTLQAKGEGDQGLLEVTSNEGSASLGAVTLPDWLPAYSGAKVEGFAADGASGSSGGFGFKTSDSAEKVTTFYEDALKKAGFKVELTKHGSGAMLNAESGGRKAVLNVLADGSGASVNGTFEGN